MTQTLAQPVPSSFSDTRNYRGWRIVVAIGNAEVFTAKTVSPAPERVEREVGLQTRSFRTVVDEAKRIIDRRIARAPSPAADRAAARDDCRELVRASLEGFCEFIGSRPEASAVAIESFLARWPVVPAGK